VDDRGDRGVHACVVGPAAHHLGLQLKNLHRRGPQARDAVAAQAWAHRLAQG